MGLALLIPDILAIVVSFITVGLTLPCGGGLLCLWTLVAPLIESGWSGE